MFESTDLRFATAYYHWFQMLQPAPLPEKMLQGVVPFNILGRVGRPEPDLSAFSPAAVREYVKAFKDPKAVHASCEDYRAAATIDLNVERTHDNHFCRADNVSHTWVYFRVEIFELHPHHWRPRLFVVFKYNLQQQLKPHTKPGCVLTTSRKFNEFESSSGAASASAIGNS